MGPGAQTGPGGMMAPGGMPGGMMGPGECPADDGARRPEGSGSAVAGNHIAEHPSAVAGKTTQVQPW